MEHLRTTIKRVKAKGPKAAETNVGFPILGLQRQKIALMNMHGGHEQGGMRSEEVEGDRDDVDR